MTEKIPAIATVVELEASPPPARFRYGSRRFRRDMATAIAMTVVLCLLALMLLVVAGSHHPLFYTLVCALSFFTFISARSVYRFATRSVILAVTPAGIHDLRIGQELIPWDNVRDLAFSPQEGDVVLKIAVWKGGLPNASNTGLQYSLNLGELDRKAEEILSTINRHHPVRFDHDMQKSPGH